jgi:geranylgeranyl pyrophosphate synthase
MSYEGFHLLSDIIKLRTNDLEVKKRYIEILEETGTIKYTRDFMARLYNEMIEKFKELGDNPPLRKAMDGIIKEINSSKIDI